MNNAQKTVRRLKIIACVGTNENKTPLADPHAGVDELLLLKRNRAVVQLLRDEEALFDEENFERRVQPPGHKARARIAFELRKILEFEEAESLLAYLDKRGWNFRFSLALRDLRLTYKPHWIFRFFLFGAIWFVISLPFIPVNFNSLIFFNPDWRLLKIVLIICGAASALPRSFTTSLRNTAGVGALAVAPDYYEIRKSRLNADFCRIAGWETIEHKYLFCPFYFRSFLRLYLLKRFYKCKRLR